ENLREVIERARFVLFDFDGPICRLFAGHSAEDVAKDLVERQGLRGLLTEEEQVHPDPMVVLYAVHRRHPHSDLVSELEERLTQQELKPQQDVRQGPGRGVRGNRRVLPGRRPRGGHTGDPGDLRFTQHVDHGSGYVRRAAKPSQQRPLQPGSAATLTCSGRRRLRRYEVRTARCSSTRSRRRPSQR
ncbi:hypothetical protein ACFYTG_52915, partial [Streptomyces mirabilis]